MKYAVVLAALLSSMSLRADIIAYDNQAPTSGDQAYSGSLGLDFNTNKSIHITRIGVYDSNQDGLQTPITAYIYDRNTQTAILTQLFSVGSGTLVNGQRFLPVSLYLAAGGQYSVVADGYNNSELNGNINTGWTTPPALNNGGGALTFAGSRYGSAGVYPTINTGYVQHDNEFGAGTFAFTVTPEPSSVVLLGSLLFFGATSIRRKLR